MEFTDKQIIEAMTGLLSSLADKNCPALERSDIRPHLVGETGIWVDPDVQGDENAPKDEYIGLGFFINDAVDADDGSPFMTAVKIHKPSFCASPKAYSMTMAMNLSKGIGKMQGEMHSTAQKEARKIRALMDKGSIRVQDRLH